MRGQIGKNTFTGKARKELLGWVRYCSEEDSGVSIHGWQQNPVEKGLGGDSVCPSAYQNEHGFPLP